MDSTHINLKVCEEKRQYLSEAIRKLKTVQSNLNDIHTALSRVSNPETYTAVRTALERTYTELESRIGTAETMESAFDQVIAIYRQAENKLLQEALERAKKLEELLAPVHAALDFMGLIPGAGALFDGANALCYLTEGNPKDALWAGIGAIPVGGDAAKAVKDAGKVAELAKDAKKADKALEAAEAAEKAAEKAKKAAKTGKKAEDAAESGKTSLPETKYITQKLQHEYKHAGDFGIEGNWNNSNAMKYQQTIQNHIDTAPDIYFSKYRGEDIYVYYNSETGLGTYVDLAGNYVAGWKLSKEQIQYHIKNGIKIK